MFVAGARAAGPRQKPARRADFDLRLNRKLSWRIKLICPVQSCRKKYSDFQKSQISLYFCLSCSDRGALAIATDVERDAVDAEAPITNGA
jgi:hypothetical protein